jgi:hypothetical protein
MFRRIILSILVLTTACRSERILGIRIEQARATGPAVADGYGPDPASYAPCDGQYLNFRVDWPQVRLSEEHLDLFLLPDGHLLRRVVGRTIARSYQRPDTTTLAVSYTPDQQSRWFGASLLPREYRHEEGACRLALLGEDALLFSHVEAARASADSFFVSYAVVVKDNYHNFALVAIGRSRASRDSLVSALYHARTLNLRGRSQGTALH